MTVGLKKRLILAQVCKQNKSGLDRVIILSERQAAGLCRAVFTNSGHGALPEDCATAGPLLSLKLLIMMLQRLDSKWHE